MIFLFAQYLGEVEVKMAGIRGMGPILNLPIILTWRQSPPRVLMRCLFLSSRAIVIGGDQDQFSILNTHIFIRLAS